MTFVQVWSGKACSFVLLPWCYITPAALNQFKCLDFLYATIGSYFEICLFLFFFTSYSSSSCFSFFFLHHLPFYLPGNNPMRAALLNFVIFPQEVVEVSWIGRKLGLFIFFILFNLFVFFLMLVYDRILLFFSASIK